jgi:4'-phosphopantetheinyl transferase
MFDALTWSTPPNSLELSEGETHIWRANLDTGPEVLRRLGTTLDNDEKARAARFHFARDRDYFAACRGILRELLGRYLGRSPECIEFLYGAQGKPAYRPRDPGPPVRFNISHSHGLAVFGFARGREVGIDLERIRPEFAGQEIADRYFSAQELVELQALPAAIKPEGFFLCWTRKEAYVKARGLGLQVPLDSFSVSLTPSQPELLQSEDSRRWSLHSFKPAPDFVAAIVQEGQEFRPRYWDWAVLGGTPFSPAVQM